MSDTLVRPETIREAGAFSSGLAGPEDYVALLKPRVMSLVVFTGLVGLVLAPGAIHPVLGAIAILCIAVGAGASGALNMWYDADIDGRMERTAGRPIPQGRVAADDALWFGLVLSAGSVLLMALCVGWMAAGLLAFTIFFYAVIYTMGLKRRTAQNIVIGGAAGALPPVIGWAAVTGSVALEPLALFLIIFLWTPPHFWALALVRSDDYKAVGVPMLPVVQGRAATRRQIVLYTGLLLASSALPLVMGFAGWAYGATAGLSAAAFGHSLWRLLRTETGSVEERGAAMRLFAVSILYLFLLFLALLGEGLWARFAA
jgi:protoheme IX farnesyltransferase